jgi:hypothetical protein
MSLAASFSRWCVLSSTPPIVRFSGLLDNRLQPPLGSCVNTAVEKPAEAGYKMFQHDADHRLMVIN